MKTLTTNEKIAVVIGIVVVGFFFVFGNILINIFKTGTLSAPAANQTQTMTDTASSTETSTAGATQLGIQDVTVGTGLTAEVGDTVTVNYVGTLTDGTVFDSSVARNSPFTFTLGAGQVIPGWDQGLIGMQAGGKRVLTIPPSLGYGSQTYGPIPGGSTLIFQVELLKVTLPTPTSTK